jgi:hypothetical protein
MKVSAGTDGAAFAFIAAAALIGLITGRPRQKQTLLIGRS